MLSYSLFPTERTIFLVTEKYRENSVIFVVNNNVFRSVPPQVHGNDYKKGIALELQAAADTFIESVRKEDNLNLEFIDFDVHGSHILKVNSGDNQRPQINIGLTKTLLRHMIKNNANDIDLILVLFPDLERTRRAKMDRIQSGPVENVHFNLKLTSLALDLWPKSGDTWIFRRFLLRKSNFDMKKEFQLILKAADRHHCNYYAWEHARLVLSLSDKPSLSPEILADVLKFGETHVTDSSVFAFLQFISSQHLPEVRKLADKMVDLYPSNQLVWTLRLSLVQNKEESSNEKLLFGRLFGLDDDGGVFFQNQIARLDSLFDQ